jgi:hypothetical protein
MKSKILFGLLMLLATACKSKDDTMIVVEVWSDLPVPSQLASVRMDVTGPTSSTTKSYKLSGPNQLPVHLALVPDGGNADILMVRATGLLDGGYEFVSQAAWVAFVPGESKLLKLFLGNSCAYACGLSQSCSSGACSSVPTITNLPDYNPNGPVPATGGMGGAPTVAGGSGHSGGAIIGPGGTIVPYGGSVRTGGISSTSTFGGSITSGGSKSSGGISGIGGVVTSGGSKSTGGISGGTCAVGKACGGDVVGTWDVSSSCLNYSGYADISYLGLTCIPNTALITGSVAVTGTLTLNANGKYTDKTVTKGSESWVLDRSCLILSGTKVSCSAIGTVFSGSLSGFGYESFQCVDAVSGGCNCQGTINQPGGLGLLSNDMSPTGSYKVNGNTLNMGDLSRYSYCVNGTSMTMVPNPDTTYGATPYTGTVVLQKSCSGTVCTGGTGGTSSSGGGSGGSVSTGGSKSSGGSTSSSGASCPSVAACGGDVVGAWNVASSCLKLDGDFETRGTGLGCDKAKVTGSLQVKGSFVAARGKQFQDKTTTTGSVTVTLDHQCLWMSGTWTQCDLISVAIEGLGFKDVKCSDAAGGGCTCPGTIDNQGNMGLIVADPQTSGDYTISSTTLATGENPLTGAALEYSYCVTGDKLTVTPKTTSPPTTGTIVLQRAAGGAGGSVGTN